MSAAEMVAVSLLLGLFVLLAGTYGVLYSLARLRLRRAFAVAAGAAWGALALVAAALVAFTALGAGWKLLIAASALVYLPLPPLVWRYLENLHRLKEQHL